MIENLPENKQIILFDGVCNLCNSSVQYVIKRDKNNRFMFLALQSNTAKKLLEQYDSSLLNADSIMLYSPKKGIYSKSTAALKIASQLTFPVNLLGVFLIVPKFIRHWFYDYVAKNRYKWYGKKEACMIPTPELKNRFIN